MYKIAKVRYDVADHEITMVQFDNGSEVSISDAIAMAKRGDIQGVNVGRARDGRETLRSYPDGDPANNLVNLPKF